MNEKNADYLARQLKFTGFGENHTEELKVKMEKKSAEFMITHQQDFGKDNTVATLLFNKSKEGDLYFFNRYTLVVKNQLHPDPIKQTFYVNNDQQKKEQENITLKEGYNLMSDRAVNKELVAKNGEKYQAWIQLDFKETDKHGNYIVKQFHQNYGYDLEKALGRQPIKELADTNGKERLLESLKRGNRQSVTMVIDGKEQKVAIEAAPQFKSLNFYNGDGQRIKAEKLYETPSNAETVKQDMKKERHPGDEEEGGGLQQEKKIKRQGQRVG